MDPYNISIKDYLDRLGKDWDSVPGLRDHTILILLLMGLVIKFYALLPGLCFGLFFLSVNYFFWKAKRLIVFAALHKVNIIFCFHNATKTESIERYIRNFESAFTQSISNFNIQKLKVTFIASDHRIYLVEQAQKDVQKGKTGQTLIIWGDVTETESDIRCRNTNFTYEFVVKYISQNSINTIRNEFVTENQNIINTYNWNFNLKDRNQFESYADNIKDISVYILARTIITLGKVTEGLALLEQLLSSLQNLPNGPRSQRIGMISYISKYISYVYVNLSEEGYYKENWPSMRDNLLASLRYDVNNYDSYIGLAYYYEVIEDNEIESLKYLDKAEQIHLPGQNTHLVSRAYFKFKYQNFTEAVRIYNKLLTTNLQTNPVMLADNLEQTFKKKKLPQFLFAEGFVKYVWLPTSNGRARLKKFLRETEGDLLYEPLQKVAVEILNNPDFKKSKIK